MRYLFFLLFTMSCAQMKSGRYVKNPNGQWVFIAEESGLIQLFDSEEPSMGYWNGDLAWPVPAIRKVSSGFGKRWGRPHQGIDIPGPVGTTVVCADDGKVVYSGRMRGYGRIIIVAHGRNMKTVYAHNSRLLVGKGEKVHRGQPIAKLGSSGKSTGPHLHFEVRHRGYARNPLPYFTKRLANR